MDNKDIIEHPAVKAWFELKRDSYTPKCIEIIRDNSGDIYGKQNSKSQVYRLKNVGPENTDVIAKRCRSHTAEKERLVYEKILPQLPLPTINYYGHVEDSDNISCWVFIEDAGEQIYSRDNLRHRILAARWLGLMHVSASCIYEVNHLPNLTPQRYLDHLKSAHNNIVNNINNPSLSNEDVYTLKAIISNFDVLESGWHILECDCESIPSTLVHGDLSAKNTRIRYSNNGISLFVFDWETSFCGLPAIDLSILWRYGGLRPKIREASTTFLSNQVIGTYLNSVQDYWSNLDLQTIKWLANVGTLLISLAQIDQKSLNLAYEWVEKTMSNLRVFNSRLTESARTIGLMD